jgi:hypothetical protein
MKHKNFLLFVAFTILSIPSLVSIPAFAKEAHKSTAKLTILEPKNGAIVGTTFTVKFAATGVDIVPAGVEQENSGHYHLLIDTNKLPNNEAPMITSPTLLHFGKAQTETELTLTPGKHSLQLVLGDYAHRIGATPIISKKIKVTVK